MPDVHGILVYCMVVRPHQAFAGLPRNIGSLHMANGRGFLVLFLFGEDSLFGIRTTHKHWLPAREYATQALIRREGVALGQTYVPAPTGTSRPWGFLASPPGFQALRHSGSTLRTYFLGAARMIPDFKTCRTEFGR